MQEVGTFCYVGANIGLAQARSNGRQWFFFCLRKEKYRNSGRLERTVSTIGYWKITSLDTKITREHTGEEIGKKKLLTFYRGRTPNGIITSWGMHEYHLNPSCLGYNDTEEVLFYLYVLLIRVKALSYIYNLSFEQLFLNIFLTYIADALCCLSCVQKRWREASYRWQCWIEQPCCHIWKLTICLRKGSDTGDISYTYDFILAICVGCTAIADLRILSHYILLNSSPEMEMTAINMAKSHSHVRSHM